MLHIILFPHFKCLILILGGVPNFDAGDSEHLPRTSTHPNCTDKKQYCKQQYSINSDLDDTFSSLDLELIDSLESQHNSTKDKPNKAALPDDSKCKKFLLKT